ncbi:MAG: phospholipase D-like domain-containing protein [Lachnospiraceae bacterium]
MEQLDKEEKENLGMSLLKKGQKGIVSVIFSRVGFVTLILLLQFFLLFTIFYWFASMLPYYIGGSVLFTIVMVLHLINGNYDPTAKITWLIVIMLLPIFGSLLLWYTQSDIGHRALRDRISQLMRQTENAIPSSEQTILELAADNPGAASLCRYIGRTGCFPLYKNTTVTYFPLGEKKWEEMLKQLEEAKDFIFMEYFIIDEGLMWGRVLEILSRKAAEGVDVRVMYDGTCEFSSLPHDYPKRLKAHGIKCKMFAPVTPFASTHYNFRDHRKILVIDGKTAFNGGVNLADEYINHKKKYGHWKDTAVMLQGEAVKSFTLMFLQMWNIDEKNPSFTPFLNRPELKIPEAEGYVLPYGDCPLDSYQVGECVYMDLLNRAHKYVHIMTPYLILDGEMNTALKFAAERGIEVILILPGIPDKKAPYALAKTHYRSLLASGVQIYEYTPGFVHAKVFVIDDREAVVGTINLDYRSLYHHFECATYMYKTGCISSIEGDFQDTLQKCRKVTEATVKKEKWTSKLTGYLLKIIAPLL